MKPPRRFALLIVLTLVVQACATSQKKEPDPMETIRYERAVERQFDDNYQQRLKP